MIQEFPRWKSRKFWVLVLDTIVSIAVFLIGQYVFEAEANVILFLIGALQPVFLMLIGAYTYQNVKLEE